MTQQKDNVMDLHQKSMNQESFSVTLGDFFCAWK